jgi:hypothetical protein
LPYSPQYYAAPVSPDGKFWWNGFQWLPLQRQTNPAIFLAVGCVVVLVILAVAAAIGAATFHGSIYIDNNIAIPSFNNGPVP